MMHRDARALDLCPCITRDVPYDARMMHRDALMRLMHLGLGDAWCIKPGRLSPQVPYWQFRQLRGPAPQDRTRFNISTVVWNGV